MFECRSARQTQKRLSGCRARSKTTPCFALPQGNMQGENPQRKEGVTRITRSPAFDDLRDPQLAEELKAATQASEQGLQRPRLCELG